MAISFSVGVGGDWERGLDRLAARVKTKLLRSGGNAASEAFQQEAQRFAPVYDVAKHGPPPPGSRIKPGQLREAIYRAYDEKRSTPERAVYVVSWNHSKAPHGHWMEYGNARHPAHSFLRPAWYTGRDDAGREAIKRMERRFAELEGGE